MIGIIDYGMGNLHSVSKALERLDYDYFISENVNELKEAKGLILPGVGSFKDAMVALEEGGLKDFIIDWVNSDRPLFGICLGMQLLFEESEENGLTQGLCLLPGKVKLFAGVTEDGKAYKVPHMGWNRLKFLQPNDQLLAKTEEGHVYFVHSYVVQTDNRDILIAVSEYDVEVPAVVGKKNVFGAQFHPEKSSTLGMAILRNFAAVVEEGEKVK